MPITWCYTLEAGTSSWWHQLAEPLLLAERTTFQIVLKYPILAIVCHCSRAEDICQQPAKSCALAISHCTGRLVLEVLSQQLLAALY
jgi:hypothetical protein